MKLTHLRCEHLEDPLGVDRLQPRLSWHLIDERAGARQTAFQVQVASAPEKLVANEPDRWDSGKLPLLGLPEVTYSGGPLRSHDECFWRVRGWDVN